MKEEKGITLVALVITIIVLLIIAAVAVSMVIGPHGIAQTVEKEKESSAKVAAQNDLNEALKSIKDTYSKETEEEITEDEVEEQASVEDETEEISEEEKDEEGSLISKCTKDNFSTLLPKYEFSDVDTSTETVKVVFTDSIYRYTATVDSDLTISEFQQETK